MAAIKDIELQKVGDSCDQCGGNLSKMLINKQVAESVLLCEYCNSDEEIEETAVQYFNEQND